MKQNYSYAWPVLLAGFIFAGCQAKNQQSDAVQPPVLLGPKYSAKKGLELPEETRRSLGVKIVEVTENKVPATINLELRVYQTDNESSFASAAVTLEEVQLLKAGAVVQARLDGIILTGTVTRVNLRLQKATGMGEVLVEMSHRAGGLRAGLFVPATVAVDSETTMVSIPQAALLRCSDGHSVYTVSGDHLVRTAVKVGAVRDGFVAIKEGLFAGDQVVLEPVMSLWMTELAAIKGGQACCPVPGRGK